MKTDIICKWDELFKVYMVSPLTDAGNAWIKAYKGVYMKQTGICRALFEGCYTSMLNCGLTVERTD